MQLSVIIQIAASCLGIVGSLFFAIGVIRQSTDAMAKLSGTYWDWNIHMIRALAAQKADYLFGGCIIVMAFSAQLLSFLVPPDLVIFEPDLSTQITWGAVVITILAFLFLRVISKRVSAKFEKQILNLMEERQREREEKRQREQAAKSD